MAAVVLSRSNAPMSVPGVPDVSVFPHAVATAVRLLPGDTVVLYTDGATDVPDPDGLSADEFQDLVATAVSGADNAEMVADRLHEQLSSIRPIEQRSDDIALLVLRVKGPGDLDR